MQFLSRMVSGLRKNIKSLEAALAPMLHAAPKPLFSEF